jgi:hypothetical protein
VCIQSSIRESIVTIRCLSQSALPPHGMTECLPNAFSPFSIVMDYVTNTHCLQRENAHWDHQGKHLPFNYLSKRNEMSNEKTFTEKFYRKG